MIQFPDLPYADDALDPHISGKTLQFHHGKHHKTYVEKANSLINDTEFADLDLEEIIKKTYGVAQHTAIFNNTAQAWNHTFYWHCMKPEGGGEPEGEIADRINSTFDSYDNFVSVFMEAATGRFGSGWAWLVLDDDQLKIVNTINAETPLAENKKPLLTVDVWEHAYYLDYQNKRAEYLENFIKNLINWDFVNANLK
jgi:Fe-Mn family superoxide dismutase